MARCGSTSMLHPVLRWGCDWNPTKLFHPESRCSSVFKRHPGLAAVYCFSAKRRRHSNFLTSVRSQELHINSAFDQLNAEQMAAVLTQQDCVRVVAGPGSGKTLVLTHRIAHLIKNRGVNPSNMLCLTFTNKAKDELQQRLGKLLGENVCRKLTIGTFHSVCVKMLRESATKEDVGVDKDFVIYDDQDCNKVVKKMLEEMADEDIDVESTLQIRHLNMTSEESDEVSSIDIESTLQIRHLNTNSKESDEVKKRKKLAVLSQCIQRSTKRIAQVKHYELKNFIAKQNQPYKLLEIPPTLKTVLPEFNRYKSMLRSCNAVDFDDLINLTVRMLYQRSDLYLKYQNRWSYVLADEFQDTDWVQYVLIRRLCGTNQNLFVVGDVDQAIYGWRGADYKNMEALERHFQGLTTFELLRNYRSSQSILSLASEVINRSNRPTESLKPLKLQPMQPKGAPVTITQCLDSDAEAGYVLNKIIELEDTRQAAYGSIGILYRTKMQGQALEKWCIAFQIPYVISGSTALFSYKVVQDLRAYLQLVWNSEDRVALDRVINTPPRGLGPKTLRNIEQWASSLNISFPQALQKISKEKTGHKDLAITLKARNSLLEFCKLQEDLLKQSEDSSVSMLIQEVIDRTQMSEYHKRSNENYGKLAYHIHLFRASAESLEVEHGLGRSALCLFLEAVALSANLDQENEKLDAVKLSTLHAAKGLEFDCVFIIGVEEGNLPCGNSDLEEERRLFYVGVTRARKELFITSRQRIFVPGRGFQSARVSQFLSFPSSLYQKELVTSCCLENHASINGWP